MDWISHLLFSLSLGAILLKDRNREKMVLVALASLFPDLDVLWYHRSGLHSPFILLFLALVLTIRNRAFFAPLLIGFWSHSTLDIFLFDNSNHTIKNLANQVIGNDIIARHIEDNITRYASADGIMLLWPFSGERFSITLEEKSYAIVAGFIVIIAVLSFLWLYCRRK